MSDEQEGDLAALSFKWGNSNNNKRDIAALSES